MTEELDDDTISAATKRAEVRTVHILQAGLSLCGFSVSAPDTWSNNHFWVCKERSEMDATPDKNRCAECWIVALK